MICCLAATDAKWTTADAKTEIKIGKIAKVEGPQISFAEVEGLGTGTAVNRPIVAVALKTRSSSQKVQGTQVVTSEFDRQERPPSL